MKLKGSKKLTRDQINKIQELVHSGHQPKEITTMTGINYNTVRSNIQRGLNRPNRMQVVYASESKLKILQTKMENAKRILETKQPGDLIILQYYHDKKLRQKSGQVITKYPDKLIVKNNHGHSMITMADLMTCRVMENQNSGQLAVN